MNRILFALLLICAFACDKEIVTFNDIGTTCIEQGLSNNSHQIDILFEACGSPCDDVIESSCSAILEGDLVKVSSTFTFIPPSPREVCAEICVEHRAGCSIDALPEGDYILDYDGEQIPFQIAKEEGIICTGE